MKNIFKTLFVFLLGIFCTYIVWAVGCFLFTGTWLGVITEEEGVVPYCFVAFITIALLFIYLNDTDYYS